MLTGAPASLDFYGSQTFDNAAVALGGSLTALSGTLTLGPTTSINASGTLAALASATIVNLGSIAASGAYFDVVGTFINEGAISINTLFGFHGFRAGSATFINAVGGSLAIGTKASGTLGSTGSTFSNQGTITLAKGARLYLGGSFDQTNIVS